MSERAPLKPCPFCGGRAWERIQDGSLVISCQTCGAGLNRALVPAAEWEKVPPRAREAWNSRTTTPDSALPAGPREETTT